MSSSSSDINTHDLGDIVKVSATFTNPDNDDALLDPSVVKLSVKNPSGTVTTYTYLDGVVIVRDSVGLYHALIDADEAGTWYYRWWSTGTGQAAQEKQFNVNEAEAIEE